MIDLAAIILAGGRSQRMGQDKAGLRWDGQTAVARLAATAQAAGAEAVRVSGGDYGLPFTRDPQAFGGPVGGILAAAADLPASRRLLILAVDAPTVTPEDLAPLLNAPAPGAAYARLPLPMVVWREAMPWRLPANSPIRHLIADAGLAELPAPESALTRLRGANTPDEVELLRHSGLSVEAPA